MRLNRGERFRGAPRPELKNYKQKTAINRLENRYCCHGQGTIPKDQGDIMDVRQIKGLTTIPAAPAIPCQRLHRLCPSLRQLQHLPSLSPQNLHHHQTHPGNLQSSPSCPKRQLCALPHSPSLHIKGLIQNDPFQRSGSLSFRVSCV